MASNSFECCLCANPKDSVPEELSNIIKHLKKQDNEIAKKADDSSLSTVAKSGKYNDLIDKPTIVSVDNTLTQSGKAADAKVAGDSIMALNNEIAKKADDSSLSTVAKSGKYNDLIDKPTIVSVDNTLTQSGKAADAKVTGDSIRALNNEIAKKADDNSLSTVAKSGKYNDLIDKPIIVSVDNTLTQSGKAADAKVAGDSIRALNQSKVYATPEMYGAVGDGETDDTEALQRAIDSGRDVLLISKYRVREVKLAPYVTMTSAPSGRIVDGKVMMCPYSSIVGVVFEATSSNTNGCLIDIGTYDAVGVSESGGDDRYTVKDVKVLTDFAIKSNLDFVYVHVGDGELAHLFGIFISNISINGRLGKVFHFKSVLNAGNIEDNGNGVWINTVNIEDIWCGVPEYIVYIDCYDPGGLKARLGKTLRIGNIYLTHVTGEYSSYAKNDAYIDFPSSIITTDFGLVDKGYTRDGVDPATAVYNIVKQPWYNSAKTIIQTDYLGDKFFAYAMLSNQNIAYINGSYTVSAYTLYETFRNTALPYASMLKSSLTSDVPAETNSLTLNLIRQDDESIFMGVGLNERMVLRGRLQDGGSTLSLYLRKRPVIGYDDKIGCLYSDLYMPYAMSLAQLGNNYVPVIGSMLFNTMTNRPMWYTGDKWVYADGTDANFS